jgi:hypothetical protein
MRYTHAYTSTPHKLLFRIYIHTIHAAKSRAPSPPPLSLPREEQPCLRTQWRGATTHEKNNKGEKAEEEALNISLNKRTAVREKGRGGKEGRSRCAGDKAHRLLPSLLRHTTTLGKMNQVPPAPPSLFLLSLSLSRSVRPRCA